MHMSVGWLLTPNEGLSNSGPVYTMPVRRRFDLTPVWNLLFFDNPFTRVRYDAGIKGVKTQFGSHTGSISCPRGSIIVQTVQTGVTPKRFQFVFTSRAKATNRGLFAQSSCAFRFLVSHQQKARELFYNFQHGSQSKSHSNHCCTPTSQYCTYFANDCTL